MELIKNVFFKRIVIYLCCTLLFTSSLFMSYQVPVYAETTYADLLEDALYIAGAAAGIYFSGGTLTPTLLVPFVERLAGTGFDIYDYVTQDEEAGTTTISADFVNLVLQAYKQYQQENGDKFDGTVKFDEQSKVYVYGESEYQLSTPNNQTYASHISGFKTYLPVAFLLDPGLTNSKYFWWGTSSFDENSDRTGFGGILFYYTGHPDSFDYGIVAMGRNPSTFSERPQSIIYYNGEEQQRINDFNIQQISGPNATSPGYFISFNSSTIPVYTSFDMMKEAFHSGDYSHAENYSVGASSGESSSYTGEYVGGDITVLTEKLEGIGNKLDEIDKTGNSIDEKLKELLEWLLENGVTGSTDLTGITGWLEKIYMKLEEGFNGTIEQLKKIKHWTMADTAVNAADAVADWLDFIKGIFDDAENGAGSAVSALSSTMGDAANLMKTKFPFCIPWDVYLIIGFLAEEPQTPVFRLPIKLERLGIEEYIEIDLKDFETVSSISRTLLTVLYCYGLLNLTMKVFPVAKEGD